MAPKKVKKASTRLLTVRERDSISLYNVIRNVNALLAKKNIDVNQKEKLKKYKKLLLKLNDDRVKKIAL